MGIRACKVLYHCRTIRLHNRLTGAHSAARAKPSLHASASTCSAEPPLSMYFQPDRITYPKWFLMITPMPASPDASEKAPSVFIFIQPDAGACQLHLAGTRALVSVSFDTVAFPFRSLAPPCLMRTEYLSYCLTFGRQPSQNSERYDSPCVDQGCELVTS